MVFLRQFQTRLKNLTDHQDKLLSSQRKFYRGVAQLVSVSALGAEGRQFESGHPDIIIRGVAPPTAGYLFWEQRVVPIGSGPPRYNHPGFSPPSAEYLLWEQRPYFPPPFIFCNKKNSPLCNAIAHQPVTFDMQVAFRPKY